MKLAANLAKKVSAQLELQLLLQRLLQELKRKYTVSGTTTLIISNKDMNDIMKIVQALKYSNILLKEVKKQLKTKQKNKKEDF